MKIAAIIPAFNESAHIRQIISITSQYVDLVVVVDDGSNDDTLEGLYDFQNSYNKLNILHHVVNLGKGAALKTGSDYAIESGCDTLIYLDGDGQHDPNEIPHLIEEQTERKVMMVFGSRTIGKDMPLVMMLGNKFLSIMCNLFFGVYISDTQSGFRLLTADAYKKIRWQSSSYAVEAEMISKIKRNNITFSETTVNTIYKDNYKGTTVIDGLRIFFEMIKWKLQ